MNNVLRDEVYMDTIEYIIDEIDDIAVEAHTFRIDNDFQLHYASATFNAALTWNEFRRDWAEAKKLYKKADLMHDLSVQREALIMEKRLIEKYIHKVDTIEENAFVNIAFFVGLVGLTIGLSALVLTIPESAAAVSMGETAFNASTFGKLTGKTFAQHTALNKVGTAAKVGASISWAATVLKVLAMGMTYNNPSAKSILKSQRATGVFSKQLLVSTLYRYRANVDKKIKLNMTNTVLNTDEFAIQAVEKYSNDFLDNYVKQTETMQGKMNDFAADLAKKHANEWSKIYDAKSFDKAVSSKPKGDSNSSKPKGDSNNGSNSKNTTVHIDKNGAKFTKETKKLLKSLGVTY